MSDRQKEEKRQRNLAYAKKFKKKKKKKPAAANSNPFIMLAPSAGPFPATCARCKQLTEVPFRPTGLKPVYCDSCFQLVRSGAWVPPSLEATPVSIPVGPESEPPHNAATAVS